MLLLDLPVVLALLLGTILASTDPVVLRDSCIPRSVRRALSVEAGTNDIVVLPILLVLIAIAHADLGGPAEWLVFLGQLFVLGPVAGFAVGAAGAWTMGWVDQRFRIRREYQSLYGIGLVLAAYVAGEAVGGDGFLAAFAAGLAVTALNQTLCDCFLDFGQVIAEMTMLLAFVLFGALLSTMLGDIPLLPALALALLGIFVIRPVVVRSVLRVGRAGLSRYARQFIGWFGPRGLNSLLFALLVVDQGVRGGEELLAVVGVVVLVSVGAHGATATPLAGWYARKAEQETLAEERASTGAGLFTHAPDDVPRVTPEPARPAPGRAGPAAGAGRPQPLRARLATAFASPAASGSCPTRSPNGWPTAPRSAVRAGLHLTAGADQRPCGATAPPPGLPGRGVARGPERLARQPSRGTTTDAA
jgi:NhaP-type Na+/H+ or K+/H+ antiporter